MKIKKINLRIQIPALLVGAMILAGCGGSKESAKATPPQESKPQAPVVQQPQAPKQFYTVGQLIPLGEKKSSPEWTQYEGGIIEIDDEKQLWIKGDGESKSDKIAKRFAEGDAQGRLSESISNVIASQFAQAWESLGVGEEESIQQAGIGLTATKTRVRVRGFRLLKSFKQQVAPIEFLSSDGQPQKLGSARWQYVVMMGMPYQYYLEHRDNVVKQYEKQATPRQKQLLDKAEQALQSLDNEPNELSISQIQ